MSELRDVRCRGCRRWLALGPRTFYVFCDALCAIDYPATPSEARDALMETLAQTEGFSRAQLAPMFGITRQAVTKRLDIREIRALNTMNSPSA